MNLKTVSDPLHTLITQNKVMSLMLPISTIGMFVCAGLRVLNNFVAVGEIVMSLAIYAFAVFTLMVFSTGDYRTTSYGLAAYAASPVIGLLKNLLVYSRISYANGIACAFYLGVAFIVFRGTGGTMDDIKKLAADKLNSASEYLNKKNPGQSVVPEAVLEEEEGAAPNADETVTGTLTSDDKQEKNE